MLEFLSGGVERCGTRMLGLDAARMCVSGLQPPPPPRHPSATSTTPLLPYHRAPARAVRAGRHAVADGGSGGDGGNVVLRATTQ